MGRPGVPLGVFFRMLFVGYFEGLQSHRAIAWWCSDRRSLGYFLGLSPTDPVPNHSCVSKTHKRLPKEIFDEVFNFIFSGGARRTWLRGIASVTKRHLMVVAARNLSAIMRAIIGIGGPRSLQGLRSLMQAARTHFGRLMSALDRLVAALVWSASHGSRAPSG